MCSVVFIAPMLLPNMGDCRFCRVNLICPIACSCTLAVLDLVTSLEFCQKEACLVYKDIFVRFLLISIQTSPGSLSGSIAHNLIRPDWMSRTFRSEYKIDYEYHFSNLVHMLWIIMLHSSLMPISHFQLVSSRKEWGLREPNWIEI